MEVGASVQLLVTSFVCHGTKDCEIKVLHSRKAENNRLSVHVFGVHASAQNLSCFLIVSLFCSLDCASKRLDESSWFLAWRLTPIPHCVLRKFGYLKKGTCL